MVIYVHSGLGDPSSLTLRDMGLCREYNVTSVSYLCLSRSSVNTVPSPRCFNTWLAFCIFCYFEIVFWHALPTVAFLYGYFYRRTNRSYWTELIGHPSARVTYPRWRCQIPHNDTKDVKTLRTTGTGGGSSASSRRLHPVRLSKISDSSQVGLWCSLYRLACRSGSG